MNSLPDEVDVRQRLRDWLASNARKPAAGKLRDDTLILDERLITSLQLMELILFVERQSGRKVDILQLRPGSFRCIDTIYQTFFERGRDGQHAI